MSSSDESYSDFTCSHQQHLPRYCCKECKEEDQNNTDQVLDELQKIQV
jgi:hypothetical protein